MMMRIVLALSVVALGVALAGCGGDDAAEGTTVVASFYPVAYAAEQIAGADATVTNLTAAGVEPHDLELTAQQAKDILEADVVLYLGSGFQPAVEAAVGEREPGQPSFDLLEGQELVAGEGPHGDEEHADEKEESGIDPHVWLDPRRYAEMVRTIG
ncbi:MAG: zinc ABC transporter substrate-binding protein, partial [Actinobacteria bacterium]|nr:zinc ABC transporter substrate-binding protein [Actinomycetota bacterium]